MGRAGTPAEPVCGAALRRQAPKWGPGHRMAWAPCCARPARAPTAGRRIGWFEGRKGPNLLGGIAMPEKVMPGPVPDTAGIREAVCIHTKKIYDSCKEEDIAPYR